MRTVVRCTIAAVALLVSAPLHAQKLNTRGGPKREETTPPAPPALSADVEAALENLGQRYASEIEQIQGWYRDKPVLYFNFGFVTEPVAAGHVYWPIHGFDAKGNPVAMRGQRPIFSTIPGLPEYSGIWRLTYVVTADHVTPNYVRDMPTMEPLVHHKRASLRETNVLLNLPIVARGSRLANDTSSSMLGWYQGRDVQYFDFGEAAVAPVPMWRFANGQEANGEPKLLMQQNSIVDSVPVSGTYPDLWEIRVVHVDSAYAANSLKSAAALQRTNFVIDPHNAVRNLPITMIDGTRVERAPSPLRAFADMRSPFPPAPTRSP